MEMNFCPKLNAPEMDLKQGEHINPMNGISYFPENPLLQLELVLYSSFLHEPSFYNPSKEKNVSFGPEIRENLDQYLLFPENCLKSRQRIFYDTANNALAIDFEKTLHLAVRARQEFFMRKSPCELLAIAAQHPKRVSFNKENPLLFRETVKKVCMIPTDMISILDAWKELKGSKTGFPTFLKKAFQSVIQSMSPYHMNKYRRAVIDIIRICHPSGTKYMDELMKTGKLSMVDRDKTWEELRSQGKSWEEVLDILEWKMPHMAALYNLRGFAIHVRKETLIQRYCSMIEKGVLGGKQFPFRYLVAYESIQEAGTGKTKSMKKFYKKGIRRVDKLIVVEALEKCIQKSIENLPKLVGDVILLSDNSGSAWGAFPSELGTKTVAEIGNISALMTALSCTGRATIGLFGDTLLEYEVRKDISFLENYENIKNLIGKRGENVGGYTENGLWLFFKRSMKEPEKYCYQHFFCYSDQQAGHGGLFGNDPDMNQGWEWRKEGNFNSRTEKFLHLPKLIEDYRKRINPKLNVFTIQTAGYNDAILPQSMYRATIFSSWTGKEVDYAKKAIELWDRLDSL